MSNIKAINSRELKNGNIDFTCSHCGEDHDVRKLNGQLLRNEGIDFVFETDGDDEWCICVKCQKDFK